MSRSSRPLLAAVLLLAATTTPVLAHARPQTSTPAPGARLDQAPARIAITYDDPIDAALSSVALLDGGGNPVATTNLPVASNRQADLAPVEPLAPGPYTVAWTSLDATDGDQAQGFYTFVVNGGPVGVVSGIAQAGMPAADLVATLAVTAGEDGTSLLRIDLNDTRAVERVRIRLSRPDLGEDLLDTRPSGDGGWLLTGNEVAVPGAWHAVVIVRRTNIFDDAQAAFDFTIDPFTGAPAF
jgi:methionine-rich copper-binding protein CopC